MSFLTALMSLFVPLGLPFVPAVADEAARQARVEEPPVAEGSLSQRPVDWSGFVDAGATPVANQVRIERRVILRISPQPGVVRQDILADLPRRQPAPPRLVERPMGKCIPATGIVGVADRGSRLVIYMRDRSMVSARLEKACSPRDFYLGFYMERSDDGQLCSGRDRLLSRAGAKCQVAEMNRLVLLADDS